MTVTISSQAKDRLLGKISREFGDDKRKKSQWDFHILHNKLMHGKNCQFWDNTTSYLQIFSSSFSSLCSGGGFQHFLLIGFEYGYAIAIITCGCFSIFLCKEYF